MEHLLQRSKHSIFHNIFKYVVFQRHQKALLWSKGLISNFTTLLPKQSPNLSGIYMVHHSTKVGLSMFRH